jgi:hypothetical protein
MIELLFFFSLFIAIIIYFSYYNSSHVLKYVKSTFDNKFHLVRDLPGETELEAANMLAEIKSRLSKIVEHLRNKYKEDTDVKLLLKNFNTDNILETDINDDDTSYSINKGEEISLCLRNKNMKDHPIHDINTLMFVSLHELSHLMTPAQYDSHGKEFTENFVIILKEASEIGIYTPVDYASSPVDFCGIKIYSSPLF